MFFVGGGEDNFGLAFGDAFDAFDQLESGNFGQPDVGKYDIDFVHTQPVQSGLCVVEYVENHDVALFEQDAQAFCSEHFVFNNNDT